MNCNFRLAKYDDANDIALIKRSVWNTTYRGIYADELIDGFDLDKHTEKFKRMIDSGTYLYVVEIDNKLIGYFAFGKPFHQYEDYEMELSLLYLLGEYQGKGIGTKVFNFIKDRIKELGINRFYLCCNKYNYNSQKFYEKMGGKIIHIDEDDSLKDRVQIYYEYEI